MSSPQSHTRPTASTDTPPTHDSVADVHDTASPPIYWTTYIATVDPDADPRSIAGTCAWIATTTTGDAYCWVQRSAGQHPHTVVCTIPDRRAHGNHEALVWLLEDPLRRCYVIESETNLERPRLRVYSFRDEDPDLFDRHHGPTSQLRLCDKYEATVDAPSIPAYLQTEYDVTAPIYVDHTSAGTVTLESVPAPMSGGIHDELLDPDPSVVYACTGTVAAGSPDTRTRFDPDNQDADSDTDTSAHTTPLATDGGAR